MNFDLEMKRARLSVGELADFTFGPRDAGDGGPSGLWRARLGTEWHLQLRSATAADHPGAEFEVSVDGTLTLRGWSLGLSGRIDQLIRSDGVVTLREIKTVSRPLPADEAELRADYPGYFVQLAAYAALMRGGGEADRIQAELLFVEIDNGLAQTVALAPANDVALRGQIGRVVEFLELRLVGRDRRRNLRFRAPFAELRPGQETVQGELEAALASRQSALLLEAPTGFGKTAVLLEFALNQLRSGHFDRMVYLTGKSTGQLQVVRTLAMMSVPETPGEAPGAAPVTAWHVRNKQEHCVNTVFHCVREVCGFIANVATRWPQSGLSRFYLFDNQPHDVESLRAAGKSAGICPYEITRTALAFQDVWIGDYNYVFAPSNRSLFYERPGFQPERTLLVIDEAHNLPGRVAGAYSHAFTAGDAATALNTFDLSPAAFTAAWDDWARFLAALEPVPALSDDDEDEARRHLARLAGLIATLPLDFAAMGPWAAALLWQIPSVAEQLEDTALPRLWWVPRAGELALTCLDAAAAIGATLREFGGVVLATATPGPPEVFGEACGTALCRIEAATPWREDAYDVAYDLRVDTRFQHRTGYYPMTAATVAALCRGRGIQPIVVFFPSYAYAEAISAELASLDAGREVALQPRSADLSAQAAWVEASLASADALFLVLGSSFAESIDLLGGRVSRAMVVGPALPEVNAVQRARMATLERLGREAAFQRVYQVPGMQKVNQALGRLVRAPRQRARVLLHCRRFVEPSYADLLAPSYRGGVSLETDADLEAWLARGF